MPSLNVPSSRHAGLATHSIPCCRSATEALHRNPFVETALSYALTYVSALSSHRIKPASITILADNDYYSSSGPAHTQSPGDRFRNFNLALWDAHKTGLGSSAALVTAFTAAVLSHYLPTSVFSLDSPSARSRLHNLAQAAHCAAQGKVGSGFDVASAVFGSCLYRRFSPSLLSSLGEPGSDGFADSLKALVDETHPTTRKWDTGVTKSAVSVPKGIRLVMCDVDCGSKTPGMVKQVLAWRQENPEQAGKLWDNLQQANETLAAELVRLSETNSGDYSSLRVDIDSIRALIRQMSQLSGVPIEPPEQTDLLDACGKVPGVIGGVVPGAGGFDAVALLVEDTAETIASLDKMLSDWKFGKDGSVGRVSMLGVRQEMEGVREEKDSLYGVWLQ